MAMAEDSTAFYRALARRPELATITQQLAHATSHEVARLRVLRAIRDLGSKRRLIALARAESDHPALVRARNRDPAGRDHSLRVPATTVGGDIRLARPVTATWQDQSPADALRMHQGMQPHAAGGLIAVLPEASLAPVSTPHPRLD